MARFLTILIIFPVALLLLGGVFVVPADAQVKGPRESCKVDTSKIDFTDFDWKGTKPTSDTWKDKKTISGSSGTGIDFVSDQWGIICIIDTIATVTNWIFFLLITISGLFIVFAAFLWITSGSVPANQEKAGKMILAALVGIAIALLSRIIPGIVTGLLA